ncbi:tRNA pseudouridine(38-40) synthase TruA [Oceanibacterium hippocampi]|uniref:tRNA pseudouridine synthase A n=1 Tax=Oceanibacterium hippocampi TaxID=745714 RepID=A0A1Y5RVP5_9PROT|nr:tRNA pseudouridine(38-40) synthase TruA [Oceanibacterium hippocampi]SLN25283.1 tRNA pseudouridine synthase A [Oceanibacterium hippocampi]
MARYKLTVEYDGGPYVGWQHQENGRSVQQALEEAVRAFCGETVRIVTAGRTDAGVHALGQVVHLDLARDWPAETVMHAINQHLKPEPVAVLASVAVSEDFHARFSALARHYRYRIVNRRAPLALEHDRAWRVSRPLDAAAMHAAAQVLIGRHDFTTFRAAQCQAKSPLRTLDRLAVRREGETVLIEASARSFLHNQVRAMAGTLSLVGEGKWSAGRLAEALAACDRAAAGPNAPPHGLYLVAVDYPPES